MSRRFQLVISEDNFAKVEAYSKEMGVSLSGAVAVMINQAFEYREVVKYLPQLVGMMGEMTEAAKSLNEGVAG